MLYKRSLTHLVSYAIQVMFPSNLVGMLGDLSDVLAACRSKGVEMNLSDRLNYAEQLAAGVGYINSKGRIFLFFVYLCSF